MRFGSLGVGLVNQNPFRKDGLDEEKCSDLVLSFGAGYRRPYCKVPEDAIDMVPCLPCSKLGQPRLMEKQEARRRAAKPKIREQSPEAHPRVKRKGEELYYDEAGTGWKNLCKVILTFLRAVRWCFRAGEA